MLVRCQDHKRTGQTTRAAGAFFDTDEQVLDYVLGPSGLTWKEFKTKVRMFVPERIRGQIRAGSSQRPPASGNLFAAGG